MSAPIPTGGHRSKAARLVAETLAQPGPTHDLAYTCLSQAEGHCGRAASLFMEQVGHKRHCAQGAVQEHLDERHTMTHWCGKTITWQWYYNGVQSWPLFWDGVSGVSLIRCPKCNQKLTLP